MPTLGGVVRLIANRSKGPDSVTPSAPQGPARTGSRPPAGGDTQPGWSAALRRPRSSTALPRHACRLMPANPGPAERSDRRSLQMNARAAREGQNPAFTAGTFGNCVIVLHALPQAIGTRRGLNTSRSLSTVTASGRHGRASPASHHSPASSRQFRAGSGRARPSRSLQGAALWWRSGRSWDASGNQNGLITLAISTSSASTAIRPITSPASIGHQRCLSLTLARPGSSQHYERADRGALQVAYQRAHAPSFDRPALGPRPPDTEFAELGGANVRRQPRNGGHAAERRALRRRGVLSSRSG